MTSESFRRIAAFWAFVEAGHKVDKDVDPSIKPILDETVVLQYSANGASALVTAADMRALVKHLGGLTGTHTTHSAGETGKLTPVVSDKWKWRYDKAPTSSKIFLLTQGGVAVVGNWRDDGGFLGWNPLFDRDRAEEARVLGEKRNETSNTGRTGSGTSVNDGASPEYTGPATDPGMGPDPRRQPTDF